MPSAFLAILGRARHRLSAIPGAKLLRLAQHTQQGPQPRDNLPSPDFFYTEAYVTSDKGIPGGHSCILLIDRCATPNRSANPATPKSPKTRGDKDVNNAH